MIRVHMPEDVNQDVVFFSRTLSQSCPCLSPSEVIIEEPPKVPMHPADKIVVWGCSVAVVVVLALGYFGVIS